MTKGVWYDFVFRFVWRDDFSGTVQGWMKRRSSNTYTEVMPLTHTPTLYSATDNGQIVSSRIGPYFGIYRPRNVANDMTLWMDEIRRGPTFADVALPGPSIAGTAQAGSTLTASPGAWGSSPTTFGYQWRRCDSAGNGCSNIGGATGQSYVVAAADVNSTIRVVVTGTNASGSSSATSDQTAVVGSGGPPGGGTSLGKTAVGASTHPLGGDYLEVSGRYALASAQPVTKLTAYLKGGGSATAMRAVIYSDSGNKPGAFVAVSQPVSIGAGQAAGWVDFPLSSTALPAGQYWLGLWASNTSALGFYDGVSGSGYYAPATYSAGGSAPAAWPGGGSDDALAYSLYATVGTGGGGGASPPVNTSLPTISGTAQEGQTLTPNNGGWDNSPTSFTYQWQRCDSGGANCAATGATGSTYTPAAADVGGTIRVRVTATNAGGSANATSNQTAVVQAAAAPAPLGSTVVGAQTHRFIADFMEVSGRYTLASAQTLTKLTAYLQGGSLATPMRAVIYADSGNQPGAFVAASQQVTISVGQAAGWVDFPVSGSPTLPAGKYWLGLWASKSSVLGYYDDVFASGYYVPATYSATGNPPAGWPGAGSSGDTLSYSLYATLGGGSSPPPGAPANTSLPAITGSATQGQLLTASNGTWTNNPTGFAYQWRSCDGGGASCANVGGATTSTYTPAGGDVGRTLRVVVTATNAGGSVSATSNQTAIVQAGQVGPALGKTSVGAQTHKFVRDFMEVSGRYTLSSAQPVTKLTAYLQGGGVATAMRAMIYADSGNEPGAFVAVSQPVTIAAGQAGGWVDFPVSGSPTLPAGQYWLGLWASNTMVLGYYDDVPVSGRYAPGTYSATGNPPANWPTASSSSDTLSYSLYATLFVQPTPTNTALPAITGTTTQGQQLSTSNGAWSGSPTGYAYQWRRCDSGGASCASIGGATGSTYTLVSGDVGKTLRVVVTATNAGGSTPATSNQTAVVTPAAPANTALPAIAGTAAQGQVLTAGNGDLVEQPDRLRLPVAALRQRWGELLGDRRRNRLHLHPRRRRCRPDDPRAGDGNERGRLHCGDLDPDRGRDPGGAREHGPAGDRRHGSAGADADRDERELDRQPDLRLSMAALRLGRGELREHRRGDRLRLRPGCR